MCLMVVAYQVSPRFPLVIAANRDELYDRPSLAAHVWQEGGVIGGRDALHRGSWLAVTPRGRFAAVTNLRGAVRTDQPRSRGELVSDFVQGQAAPLPYVQEIESRLSEYGGFHLLVGDGEALAQLSGTAALLPPGIHGLSNAPAGVRWPKVDTAADAMQGALESDTPDDMVEHLLRVLRSEPSHGDPTRDLFVRGDLYGTRASTVVVVASDEVRLVEQSYGPGGAALGPRVDLRA